MSNLSNLSQTPAQLLPAAVAAGLNPSSGVLPSDIAITNKVPGKAVLTPSNSATSKANWPYYGHALATYQLLDMGAVFGSYTLRVLLPGIPATSRDVAAQLATIFGVALTAADVVLEAIPSVPGRYLDYTLKASPNSLMWTGSRVVRLYASLP